MQKESYIKTVAKAVLAPVVKSLYNGYPNLAAGFSMLGRSTFTLGTNGEHAYSNKIFYAATNILVRKLTEAPITFSKIKGKRNTDKLYSKSITNEQRKMLKELSLDELEDHQLNKLFDRPNTYQSGIELMEDFWHNYTFGDGFLYFEGLGDLSRNQEPQAIHSLSRSKVECVRSINDFDLILEYKYNTWNGKTITIPKDRILHLKNWNPNIGFLKGLGVDAIAQMDVSLNNANNEMQGQAFANGGRGTLFNSDITLDKEGDVVEKMTAQQMEVLKDDLEKNYSGVRNYRRQHFTNGYVNVQQFGDTLIEMDAINAESSSWKNIFAIVGIPVSLGPITEASTENNVKAGYKALVTNLVISELRKFDQKLKGMIAIWYPDVIPMHDLTEFTELAPDLKLMKEVYGTPLLRVDESRSIFGYDELGGEEGRAILVPSGLMQLSDLLEQDFDTNDGATEL